MIASLRARAAAGVLLFLPLAALACGTDRSLVLEPDDAAAYGVALTNPARGVPGGAALYRTPNAGAADTTDTATVVRLQNLDSLTTGTYQLWLGFAGADTAGGFVKGTGTLRVTVTDTTIDPVTGDPAVSQTVTTAPSLTSTFRNGGKRTTVELIVTRAALGGADPRSFNLALVSIEADENATSPGAARPFWARLATTTQTRTVSTDLLDTVTTRTAPVRFGTFAADPDDEYIWTPSGFGRMEFLGSVFTLDDSSLTRPPVGYYYATTVLRRNADDDSTGVLFLGAQTAPWPRRGVSLRDADVQVVDPVVQASPPAILAAATRVDADTLTGSGGVAPFTGAAHVYVTLEAKAGGDAILSPTVVLQGVVPGIVRAPPTAAVN